MFELDVRLQQDTCWLADLPLCRVLLMNDARYPWLILVPRVADVSEVFELKPVCWRRPCNRCLRRTR